MKRFGLLILLLFNFLSGCSTHSTYASYKMASLAPKESIDKIVTRLSDKPVIGMACRNWIFFVPLSSDRLVDQAWDDALNQYDGTEAITEVEVNRKPELITLVYNRECVKVRGYPVVFK